MEENKIIEADYREVSTGGDCELNQLTAEIRYMHEQLNKTLIYGIIEIGKRYERAKQLVGHGQWGDYCKNVNGHGQSMAENYIKIYKEYGSEQQSIFGDLSKSQSLGNLGVTKLLQLTAVPADEREEFVEKNNITEDTTVKELQELIKKQKSEAEDAEMKFRQKEHELEQSIRRNNDVITEKQEEIDRLRAEIKKREAEGNKPSDDEMSEMIAELEEQAKAEFQKSIDKLEKEKEKLQKTVEKQKKQYDTLQLEAKEQADKIERSEAEKAQMQAVIERLQKESLLGSNENMVRLNLLFVTAQEDIQSIKEALEEIKNTEQYDKYKEAITRTLLEAVEKLD